MKILVVQDYLRSGGTERQSVLLANACFRAAFPSSEVARRKFGRPPCFDGASAGIRTLFAAITMRGAKAPPARCQRASFFSRTPVRRPGCSRQVFARRKNLILRGAFGPEYGFAVGGIGLDVVVGEQLALAGRLRRCFGRGWQFEARLVESRRRPPSSPPGSAAARRGAGDTAGARRSGANRPDGRCRTRRRPAR